MIFVSYDSLNFWSKKGILYTVFKHLATEGDTEWQFLDSSGLPISFVISGGESHDIVRAENQIDVSGTSSILTADKGYDSESLRIWIKV